jgi:hypothetical protein
MDANVYHYGRIASDPSVVASVERDGIVLYTMVKIGFSVAKLRDDLQDAAYALKKVLRDGLLVDLSHSPEIKANPNEPEVVEQLGRLKVYLYVQAKISPDQKSKVMAMVGKYVQHVEG